MEMLPILEEIKKTEHGFRHIIKAGNTILSQPDIQHYDLAVHYLTDASYQVRMLATYMLGQLAASDQKALLILQQQVCLDSNWRVQEMLAKAFDSYCQATGYQQSLPVINKWLESENPNLKRAVIEGLRIWTSRPYFKTNPSAAIKLISRHKADPSEYVRKSVGNALRDISKKHPDLIKAETSNWDLKSLLIRFTYNLVFKSYNSNSPQIGILHVTK